MECGEVANARVETAKGRRRPTELAATHQRTVLQQCETRINAQGICRERPLELVCFKGERLVRRVELACRMVKGA